MDGKLPSLLPRECQSNCLLEFEWSFGQRIRGRREELLTDKYKDCLILQLMSISSSVTSWRNVGPELDSSKGSRGHWCQLACHWPPLVSARMPLANVIPRSHTTNQPNTYHSPSCVTEFSYVAVQYPRHGLENASAFRETRPSLRKRSIPVV